MRYIERKEFPYDPDIFKRQDTQIALTMQAEYVTRHSANPRPKFFEVDRSSGKLDPLWHVPLGARTTFSRELEMPAINIFEKPLWKLTRVGGTVMRSDKFWLAHLILQPRSDEPELAKRLEQLKIPQLDYFPMRGDQVYWNGYRYMVENVVIDPSAYWQQTNVWLGMVVECIIPPQGDAQPGINPGKLLPAEGNLA